MRCPRSIRFVKATFVAAALGYGLPIGAASDAFTISNPNWFINLTSFGYADVAADVEGGRTNPHYFREYLSGEWGAAIGYQGAPAVEWFEPSFVFPDWTTNSTFQITSPFNFQDGDGNRTPDFNADGQNIYASTIANAVFSVTQTYEFLNAGVGIAQGIRPRSAGGPGANIASDQYVLKQTYRITNRSSGPIRGVQLYQFLHGLRSTAAVFDDREYGEPSQCLGVKCSDYRFDVTMSGTARAFVDLERPFRDVQDEPTRATDVSEIFGFVPQIDDAFLQSLLGKSASAIEAAFRGVGVTIPPALVADIARSDEYVRNNDVVTLHSNDPPLGVNGVAPLGWEVGRYGVSGTDSHATGKPGSGVHLSVEGGSLNGTDTFSPARPWVSGAQVFSLGDLNPGATVTFDVLLSVGTNQSVVRALGAAGAGLSPAAAVTPLGKMLLGRLAR